MQLYEIKANNHLVRLYARSSGQAIMTFNELFPWLRDFPRTVSIAPEWEDSPALKAS